MSEVLLGTLATGFFTNVKDIAAFPFATSRILFWCVLAVLIGACAFTFSSASVRALFRRELNAYFFSPVAYVVLTVFVFISSILFFLHVTKGRLNDVGPITGTMTFLMIFICPIITMRLFSEEMRSGTIEVLMTAPITDVQVVLAKYFASLVFYTFLFVPSLAYPLVLCWLGSPDAGVVLSCYICALLVGAVYLAVGLLMSSLAKSQIVAAVAGIVFLLLFYLVGIFAESGTDWAHHTLQYLSLVEHQESLIRGIVDSRDLVFFVTFAIFFLFLTVRSVESRKWRL